MRKVTENKGTEIQISEEFQIPGTDIILEAGDRIRIQERFGNSYGFSSSRVWDLMSKFFFSNGYEEGDDYVVRDSRQMIGRTDVDTVVDVSPEIAYDRKFQAIVNSNDVVVVD